MAKKLVVRSDSDEVWVIDLEAKTIRELTGEELTTMIDSLTFVKQTSGVQNAILGDDLTEVDASTGHEKFK